MPASPTARRRGATEGRFKVESDVGYKAQTNHIKDFQIENIYVILFFPVIRKIIKILKVFKSPSDGKDESCLTRDMEQFSADIQNYPDHFQDPRAFDLKNCPCKICELKKSISLLFI